MKTKLLSVNFDHSCADISTLLDMLHTISQYEPSIHPRYGENIVDVRVGISDLESAHIDFLCRLGEGQYKDYDFRLSVKDYIK